MGEICKLTDGLYIEKELPYLDAKYFRKKIIEILDKGKYVPKDSYVILVDGENSGEVFFTDVDGYQGSTFKMLNINSFVYENYILYFIKKYHDLLKKSKVGSAIPHLNKNLFKELLLPLPPLNEQTRIVSKIEELFSILNKISLNLV